MGGGRGIKGIPLTRELHCKPQPGSFYFFSYKEITCHEEKSQDLTAFTNNTTLTSCQRRYFCSWFAFYISQHLIHSIHHLSSDEGGISCPCWAFPQTKLYSALERNLKTLFISCLWECTAGKKIQHLWTSDWQNDLQPELKVGGRTQHPKQHNKTCSEFQTEMSCLVSFTWKDLCSPKEEHKTC